MADDTALRERTATLCRMLGRQGLIGMFGHVSLRVPGTSHVLLSPGAGSEKCEVRAKDIFVLDLDGTVLEHPAGRKVPAEWKIHTQIHRDRPDALSVVHLHAPYATLLGISGRELVPVFSHGAFLRTGVPVYDNPRLITTDAQAATLSRSLGQGIAVQMRGHGVCVAGVSAEAAFFACTFLEENARKQFEAASLGGARPLSPAEAADCAAANFSQYSFDLLWQYYEHKDEMADQLGCLAAPRGLS
ncbi:MAG TPA: class II aldolase/adducin family protein [Stellaceae bacterium]|nr:class II aldolase/adducin family protein [Stellaceae bacterium]